MASETSLLTPLFAPSISPGSKSRGAQKIATGWARCLRADLLAEIAQIETNGRRLFQMVDSRRTDVTATTLAALRERLVQVETTIADYETASQGWPSGAR
jgi:hypothetical protein